MAGCRPPMTPTTGTAYRGLMFALCSCCPDHDDLPLTTRIVTCITCGLPCSCQGCVADAEG